ncbi:MAG: beta-N-acetylhexosaminidase [Shewanellaceae bacterium]|nr:beta-N-acetylhexosaminidase [Shewanellaceae bacterium]
MMDLEGTTLTSQEATWLQHPMVLGLVLFARNFESHSQLKSLIAAVRAVRHDALITIDHEGGRVQRFDQDFTYIPPMCQILASAHHQLDQATAWAQDIGWLMASELLEVGIDLTFAPVLDRSGISHVIGERAFSDNIQVIAPLARALIDGFAEAGMQACGKHFPGHGGVAADTHTDVATDARNLAEIERFDMVPFHSLIQQNKLAALMPAHVIYTAVDTQPAGFSAVWLQTVLRQQLQFQGIVFSDDLSMHAASTLGGYDARVMHALQAGCDVVLVCNAPHAVAELLQSDVWPEAPRVDPRRLCATRLGQRWHDDARYQRTQILCEKLQQAFLAQA